MASERAKEPARAHRMAAALALVKGQVRGSARAMALAVVLARTMERAWAGKSAQASDGGSARRMDRCSGRPWVVAMVVASAALKEPARAHRTGSVSARVLGREMDLGRGERWAQA